MRYFIDRSRFLGNDLSAKCNSDAGYSFGRYDSEKHFALTFDDDSYPSSQNLQITSQLVTSNTLIGVDLG